MRKYTPVYEWIEVADNQATVGLLKSWINEIGTIVYVELPKVGSVVEKGMDVAVLESTKAAVDLYAPCSGTITEVNSTLFENISLLNDAPENSGWLYKMSVENLKDLEEFQALS